MASLEGKIALVVGAAGGIGQATAALMATRGARVMVADIQTAKAEAVANDIVAAGGQADFCSVDLTQEGQISALIDKTIERFGGLDILHSNAALVDGATMLADAAGSVDKIDASMWDLVFSINLRGLMLTAKYAVPWMIARGGGAIINTSSIAGQHGQRTHTAYGTSKAAVNMLSKYIATAYGKHGIRCNAVAPGFVATKNAQAVTTAEFRRIRARHTLTPFFGSPEDIAYLVAFLASDEARYITGQIIAVDGGVTAHSPWYADEDSSSNEL